MHPARHLAAKRYQSLWRTRALKQRYAVKERTHMTLCIAALANDRAQPKIVLCSDQLLGDEYQSTDVTFKSDIGFSETLAAMFSGPWEDAQNLRRILMRKVNATELTLDNYRQIFSDGWKEFDAIFKGSENNETDAQCIVAGFIEAEPCIIRIDKSGVDTFPFFVAIGIGAYHADTILCWRKMNQFSNLERVLYCAYEAKQFGQMCKDVGLNTIMEILSLDGAGNFQVDYVKQRGIDFLEFWFKRLGPQAVDFHDDQFPPDGLHRIGSS
jgi:20S proteasome alpha/beta subunit